MSLGHRDEPYCPCSDCQAAYMRGRRKARRSLGYDDWDEPEPSVNTGPIHDADTGEQLDERRFPMANAEQIASARALLRDGQDQPDLKLLPPMVCSGCGIDECSPIGAGPFEHGFCRFCVQLNTARPIAPKPASRMRSDQIVSWPTAIRYVFHGDNRVRQVRLGVIPTSPVWVFVFVVLCMLLAVSMV